MGSASSAHERYILHMLTTRHSVLETAVVHVYVMVQRRDRVLAA